jgi:hypothetical protein
VGAHRAWLAIAITVMAACRGGSPTAPGNPPIVPDIPSGPGISDVRIAGLPRALSPGSTAQLTAELVLQTGAVKECAAPTWSVDDASVARVSSSGLLTGGVSGYVTVAVSCEGLTTRAETKVETQNKYRLIIVAHDSEVKNEFGVRARMEFLEGPRAGQSIPTSWIFSDGVADVMLPVKVRFTADGYLPRNFILSEATGTRRNADSPFFDFRVPMTFAPDASTDTFVRRMSETESVILHPFSMQTPGPVQVRTWWSVDYNDRLSVEVWCDGKMLHSIIQLFGSAGDGFTHNVATAGACEVRLRQHKWDASTHYRIAIKYPH